MVMRTRLNVKLHYISCLVLHNSNIYLQFLSKNNNKIDPLLLRDSRGKDSYENS